MKLKEQINNILEGTATREERVNAFIKLFMEYALEMVGEDVLVDENTKFNRIGKIEANATRDRIRQRIEESTK